MLNENGRRRIRPEKSPGRTWTNCPAREPLTSVGAWYDWSHWPGRISRLSTSSAAARRIVTRGASPVRRRRRRRPGSSSVAGSAPAASPASASPASRSPGDRRERLGERVGQVAEDVRRVVELDDLLGAHEVPPLAVRVVRDDLGAEARPGLEEQPLVVVVDDDQVAELVADAHRDVGEVARGGAPRTAGSAPGTTAPGRTAAAPPTPRPVGSASWLAPAAHSSAAAA